MKNGDLSNTVAPRIIVVYEGAVAYLPSEKVPEYEKALKKENWKVIAGLFSFNGPVLDRILYLTWKKNYNISIVTWFPQAIVEHIEAALDNLSIPVRSVFSSSPEDLARLLPYNPDVVCVYDPVPEHIFMFGSKGFVLTDPNQIGE
jgi:hypothetical protein